MARTARRTFYEGAKPGRRSGISTKSLDSNVVKAAFKLSQVILLGTGAVSTQTKLVARTKVAGKVLGIRYTGQKAVTGTSITAEAFARTAAGAAGNTLQSAATNIKFATDAAALTGIAGALTATAANLVLAVSQAIEVVFTATDITAGPGDVEVEITFKPDEPTETDNTFEIGADL